LIVSIRTDLETLLISRLVTLFLIPVAFFCAYKGFLPLTLIESVRGAAFGYAILAAVSLLYYLFTQKVGMGQGDIDLLAFIGAFVGIQGAWITLLIGSLVGSIAGSLHLYMTGNRKVPFGPFLSLGAMAYVLLKPQLIRLLLVH
jgi:leader peptidase (prepilin peptidase)/N-methyltransferase